MWKHKTLATKKQEKQIRAIARQESEKRMNDFLGSLSHELRTPLTSIKGNIQLSKKRLQHTETAKSIPTKELKQHLTNTEQLLERAEEQIGRLTRIVNSYLESSRITANTMDLLFEVCDLRMTIHETIKNIQPMLQSRNIHLQYSLNKDILVMADNSRIKQVLTQYLSNAHKYSPIDKPINIEIAEQNRHVFIYVRDEGQGIPFHEQKHIWEQYYRAPQTTILNGSEFGLGLGLYISKIIIEQHKGKCGLSSELGKGSTFWFMLPLAEKKLEQYNH